MLFYLISQYVYKSKNLKLVRIKSLKKTKQIEKLFDFLVSIFFCTSRSICTSKSICGKKNQLLDIINFKFKNSY